MGIIFRREILTKEGLEHIANHKYVAGKYTPLDNLLNPYWLKGAEALPDWLAPNLVTLMGLLPLIATYAWAWHDSPHFTEPPSRSLSFTTCLAMWFYQTMDAMDGKQARRTGSSTPLGQLFDHGCDCLSCISQHCASALIVLTGASIWTFAGMAALQTGFFLAQWQEYYTGVLRTSFGPVGVTETQYTLMALCLAGGIMGPEMVRHIFEDTFIELPFGMGSNAVGVITVKAWILFCIVLCSISLGKTISFVAKKEGASGVPGALAALIPVTVVNILMFAWSPAAIKTAPRELCLTTGLLFFYLAVQMIIFSMARMVYPSVQPVLIPYVALVGLSWILPAFQVRVAVSIYLVGLIFWILVWLESAMYQLTIRLGIYAFSLKKRADADKAK
eukprot:TRINITY_DN8776_c0_g3_i1.p1 TRINITY_DN8776_c0_g3~~TRINITY_DN8776_c0_g3_i1.p1  ORF type:complete len:389 (-),score=56.72 TRINITY_DN8776_c0_g3_i1:101-1267(-)